MNRFEYYSKLQEYQENHLAHHGIIGQKWGVRKYQNPDGTYTEEGKKRYFGSDSSKKDSSKKKDPEKELYKEIEALGPNASLSDIEKLVRSSKNAKKMIKDWEKEYPEMAEYESEKSSDQKVGSLFNKTQEEKELNKAKRLARELTDDNATRVIGELKNSEYGKKHIQPLYDEFDDNMKKLSDKANKIINDNPVDEIEAGIASAIDKNNGIPNIGTIIDSIRKQHYADSANGFINTDSLPLLKSKEDLWTESRNYRKEFSDKVETEIKNLYPKNKSNVIYFALMTDYENNKLEKVNNMSDEDYRRYQLYHTINYGLVPEINKEGLRKRIIEPTQNLYPKVEKIIKNTKVGDPAYDWSDIGKALVKLGLDLKNVDELTSADWKKVYEICKK